MSHLSNFGIGTTELDGENDETTNENSDDGVVITKL